MNATVRFHTEAMGVKVSGGFVVEPEFATQTGLADNLKLNVKVLTLGDGKGLKDLKLMQVEGASVESTNGTST